MNGKDLKVTAVANEVYNYLTEMCQASDIDVADLIRELAGKQQLIDLRCVVVTTQSGTRTQ
jgi:predicted CopG family antitoxin